MKTIKCIYRERKSPYSPGFSKRAITNLKTIKEILTGDEEAYVEFIDGSCEILSDLSGQTVKLGNEQIKL